MAQGKVNVLLFGLGAIGGFYAFVLSRCSNVSLSIVARSNHDALKADGLYIDSLNHGQHHIVFDKVYRSPAEIAESEFDYIVCTNKAINPAELPPVFKHLVSPKIAFVIMQNGVGNEEFFSAIYPENTILSCVIWVHAILVEKNKVEHRKPEDTELGLHRNAKLSREVEQGTLKLFYDLLIEGGTSVQLPENIQLQRWKKVVWNIAWNPITALTLVDTAEWLAKPEACRHCKWGAFGI